MDNHHHLLRKEEGFRAWFADHNKHNQILKIDIRETGYESVEAALSKVLKDHPDIQAVFVTNSRVSTVAHYFDLREAQKTVILIGYDFLEKHIHTLGTEVIDFIICQKPEENVSRGIR